jgi:hypothetical protein
LCDDREFVEEMDWAVMQIGELNFKTQKAAVAHYRSILYRYGNGVRISEPDATHLHWLLSRHPNTDQKIGRGVAQRVPEYGATGLVLIRMDGSSTDFSYLTCIKAPSDLADAKEALRAEVREDILEAKRKRMFEVIANSFLKSKGRDPDANFVTSLKTIASGGQSAIGI